MNFTPPSYNPIQYKSRLYLLRLFFGRLRSRINGILFRIPIPRALRKPIWGILGGLVLGMDLNEAKKPLEDYSNFSDLFCREIKKGARSIPTDLKPHVLTSPADGRVVSITEVNETSGHWVQQVKGASYYIPTFIGEELPKPQPGYKWISTVIYLSPADYHRFHSPTDLRITDCKHFKGDMYPIGIPLASRFDNLFSVNERLVLKCDDTSTGSKLYYVAVSAFNVGDIRITKDESIRTNRRIYETRRIDSNQYGVKVNETEYSNCKGMDHVRGEEVGYFKLGSTIVLINESPIDSRPRKKEGQEVKVGEIVWE